MHLFHRSSSHRPVHDHRLRGASDPRGRSRAELQLIADHHRDLESPITAGRIA